MTATTINLACFVFDARINLTIRVSPHGNHEKEAEVLLNRLQACDTENDTDYGLDTADGVDFIEIEDEDEGGLASYDGRLNTTIEVVADASDEKGAAKKAQAIFENIEILDPNSGKIFDVDLADGLDFVDSEPVELDDEAMAVVEKMHTAARQHGIL